MSSFSIIGLMSGSSLDGLDMALCTFTPDDVTIKWDIQAAQTVPFPGAVLSSLKTASTYSGYDLMKLDAHFGNWIGDEVAQWIKKYNLHADLIASHGHTIFHAPSERFTTQIGSGTHIAHITGINTITQFRSADIAAGGQGAPFAPVIDRDLFAEYDACINLGGISNISLHTSHDEWFAWDVCPCNQVLNFLAQRTGQPYDKNGALAAQGRIIPVLLHKLTLFFPYHEGRPKGLSNAEVEGTWISLVSDVEATVQDLLATVTEAIANLIVQHLQPLSASTTSILLSGGGAHNTFLIQRIKALSTSYAYRFDLPENLIIDFKECLLMAYLGFLNIQNQGLGIEKMTGAAKNTIGGMLHKVHP